MKENLYMSVLFSMIFFSSCNSITTRKLDHKIIEHLQQDVKNTDHNLLYKKDAVPNKEAAIKIAEAVLIPIYGEEVLEQRPFICELVKDSVWHVQGNYEVQFTDRGLSADGTASITIQKKDGKVLVITHSA